MLLNVINSEKYCHKSTGIGIGNTFPTAVLVLVSGHRQYFLAKVSLLVLTIDFTGTVNVPDKQFTVVNKLY